MKKHTVVPTLALILALLSSKPILANCDGNPWPLPPPPGSTAAASMATDGNPWPLPPPPQA